MYRKDDPSVFATILGAIVLSPVVILLSGALGAYMAFSEGYVAAALWRWFAVPEGLHAVAWPAFAGAFLMVGVVKNRYAQAQPEDARSKSEKTIALLIYYAAPWLALFSGWVIR